MMMKVSRKLFRIPVCFGLLFSSLLLTNCSSQTSVSPTAVLTERDMTLLEWNQSDYTSGNNSIVVAPEEAPTSLITEAGKVNDVSSEKVSLKASYSPAALKYVALRTWASDLE